MSAPRPTVAQDPAHPPSNVADDADVKDKDTSQADADGPKWTWQLSPIEAGRSYAWPSGAVDSSDQLHVAFWDVLDSALAYATNRSGPWEVTSVDREGNVGVMPALVVSAMEQVHIVYGDFTNQPAQLKHTTDANGAWGFAVVDDDLGNTYKGWSVCTGPAGSLHVGYTAQHGGLAEVRYATNVSGSWQMESVVNSTYLGQIESNVGIAVDSGGRAHLSYGGDRR